MKADRESVPACNCNKIRIDIEEAKEYFSKMLQRVNSEERKVRPRRKSTNMSINAIAIPEFPPEDKSDKTFIELNKNSDKQTESQRHLF